MERLEKPDMEAVKKLMHYVLEQAEQSDLVFLKAT